MERTVALGIGTNLGSRWALLRAAVHRLAMIEGVRVAAAGRPRVTKALVLPGQAMGPLFLNGVAELRTTLSLRDLLDRVLALETELGRARPERWAPRTLDLDLLDWDGPPVDEPDLRIPHPEIANRLFVQAGLADLGLGHVPVDVVAPYGLRPHIVGRRRRVALAEDAADALAWALTSATPEGPFERVSAPSAAAFVEEAMERRAASVVVYDLGPEVHGAMAPGGREGAPRWALESLERGRCELRLVE